MSLAALAVMAGHAYPVFLGFKGGKAVASFVGAFLCLTPWALAVETIVFVVVVISTRHISMGSIVGSATLPLAVWLVAKAPWPAVVASAMRAGSLSTDIVVISSDFGWGRRTYLSFEESCDYRRWKLGYRARHCAGSIAFPGSLFGCMRAIWRRAWPHRESTTFICQDSVIPTNVDITLRPAVGSGWRRDRSQCHALPPGARAVSADASRA